MVKIFWDILHPLNPPQHQILGKWLPTTQSSLEFIRKNAFAGNNGVLVNGDG
jgi:hypothetical protein